MFSASHLERRGEQIEAVDTEVTRQLVAMSSRTNSNASRASLLVATAGITVGLIDNVGTLMSWESLAAAFGLTALACGLVALWPRSGTEHDIEGMIDDVWNVGPAESTYIVLHRKLDTLKADNAALFARARWVRVGFMAYGAGLVALVLAQYLG